ncbi:unnamed protein product [Dibothriocephalus latus]|uniref:Uncharacterized protein n=1 Tax=Dibothriocephalus latus TaxID=60516 RepID=A0A3P6SKE9_DIBLA|nr:unnamed protein product [Dibothriocephalus latus]
MPGSAFKYPYVPLALIEQDKYVLMSLAILCVISIWHAVITILTISAPSLSNGTLSQSLANASDLLSSSDKTSILAGVANSHPKSQPTDGSPNIGSKFPIEDPASSVIDDSLLEPEPRNPFERLDPSLSKFTRGVEIGDFTVTDEVVSMHFLRLLKAYMDAQDQLERSPEFEDTLKRERLEMMKRLEQDVFISFVVLYIIAHSVFGFWLYFDVSSTYMYLYKMIPKCVSQYFARTPFVMSLQEFDLARRNNPVTIADR